jgi:hypothetical protein
MEALHLAGPEGDTNVTIRPNLRDLSWMAAGTVLMTVVVLLVLQNYRGDDAATKTAFRAKRLELVERMHAALSTSSEAEKSAVMATSEEASRIFAEQARSSMTVVEQRRDELGKLLETGGTREERELLLEFSQTLNQVQQVDHELLDLAGKNTNLKAYALVFGPLADALAGMDEALSRILKESATSAIPEARQVMLLASAAQSGAWRIQALLPPHIFEASDQKMDELEARMSNEDQKVRSELKALAALLGPGSSDLETARSSYARVTELKTQILDLSRQNTNVRLLIISLNQKRKALQLCQDTLDTLAQAIEAESLADRAPMSPR